MADAEKLGTTAPRLGVERTWRGGGGADMAQAHRAGT